MLAVCGAEGIHHIAVSIGSELLCELLLLLLHFLLCSLVCRIFLVDSDRLALLFRIVAEVLEKEYLARLEGCNLCVSVGAVRCELHLRYTESGCNSLPDLAKAELRLNLSLRFSHMAHNDERTTLLKDELEGRDSSADAGVVGNLSVLNRDIEVNSNDGLLASEVVVSDFHFL